MKKKKKINITVNKDIVKKIEDLSTNKSRLIEYILLEYLTKSGIEINDIIL
jgi:post-segregation antitoxin (ccd killing protein)